MLGMIVASLPPDFPRDGSSHKLLCLSRKSVHAVLHKTEKDVVLPTIMFIAFFSVGKNFGAPLNSSKFRFESMGDYSFLFFFPFQLTKVLDSKVPSNRVHEALADM